MGPTKKLVEDPCAVGLPITLTVARMLHRIINGGCLGDI